MKLENKISKPVEQFVNLMDAMKSAVLDLGIQNTLMLLENRSTNNYMSNNDIRVVTESVCEAFNMSDWSLFSQTKGYPRKYAFAIWTHICIVNFKYSFDDLVIYSGRAKVTIYKAKTYIDNLGTDSAFERKIQDKFQLSKKILEDKLNTHAKH
jgi:hypothetical protein